MLLADSFFVTETGELRLAGLLVCIPKLGVSNAPATALCTSCLMTITYQNECPVGFFKRFKYDFDIVSALQ